MTTPLKLTGFDPSSVSTNSAETVDVWLNLSRPFTLQEMEIGHEIGIRPNNDQYVLENVKLSQVQSMVNVVNEKLAKIEADAARQLADEDRAKRERDFKAKMQLDNALKKLGEVRFD
jgi:hypothetical protein